MKIELRAGGPFTRKAVAEIARIWAEAEEADTQYYREKYDLSTVLGQTTEEPEQAPETKPAKPRAKKAEKPVEQPAAEPEPAPSISTSPEDRRPPEIEDAEIVDETSVDGLFDEEPETPSKEYTIEDVRDALGQMVNKSSMAETVKWLQRLTGASKLSELKPADYAKVVDAANA